MSKDGLKKIIKQEQSDIDRLRYHRVYEDWRPHGMEFLSIEHFRSFYKKQKIKFAIPNGNPGSGLTIIVGENNSGKSSIIEALKKFEFPKKRTNDYEEMNCNVTPRFTIEASDLSDEEEIKKIIKSIKYQKYGIYKQYKGYYKDNNNVIKSTSSFYDYKLIFELYPGQNDFIFIGTDRKLSHEIKTPGYIKDKYFFNDYEENQGHIIVSQDLIDDRGNKRDVRTGSELFNEYYWQVINGIEHEYKQELVDLMQTMIPDFYDWHSEIDRYEEDDNRKYVLKYKNKKGNIHRFDNLGIGAMSLFKILSAFIIQGNIIIIDEPELYLHPQAKKKLAKLFSRESTFHQTIIITHDPTFINFRDIENGAQIVRMAKDKTDKSVIYNLDKKQITPILNLKNDWKKPHLLDLVAKEVFFSKNVIFTEGQEDSELINRFVCENNIEINFDIFGYGAGGANNIIIFLDFISNLGINAGALFDGDEKGKEELTKCRNKFNKKFKLINHSKSDIRDKDEKCKKGLFNKNGIIKGEKEKIELIEIINKFNNFFKKNY